MAAAAARQVATVARFAIPKSTTKTSFLVQRRGFASGGDHHGPPKVDCWKDPMSPSKWKEEQFVIVSLAGWGLLIYGGYSLFSGGKKDNVEKVGEGAK